MTIYKQGIAEAVAAAIVPATKVVAASDSLDPTRADYQCDGVDDDLDIETAIAALPAEGGRIVLLEGTYILGATLDIAKDYVTIEGNGPNTIIQGVTGFATITISATADHITNRNLQIKNTGTAATDYCVSIAAGTPTYITFDHCWFEGGYAGIYILDHCEPLFIEGCIFRGHVREAVRSISTVSGHLVDCHFDTLAYTGGEIVIFRDIVDGFVIADCTLDTCARGMLLHGKLLVFSSNTVYQCTNGASLTIDAGSEGAVVIGNNIRGTTVQGIRVPGATSVNIIGNIILEPSITYGIILTGTNVGIQIIGNIIEDCTTGIRIWNTSSVGTIVRGNSFRNCATPITDGGASSIIYEQYSDLFMDLLAEDTNHVVAAEDLTAATPITCTIAAQPDVPRNITIAITDADVSITAFQITVAGVDGKGNSVSEVFNFAGGLTQTGNIAFATITSVTVDSITGAGAGDVLDVGIGSKLGLSNIIYATGDVYKVKKNNADWASANYTVNTTYDTVDVSTGGAITGGDDFTIYYRSNLNIVS